MIKAIFFDIDGTLLSHTTFSISASTQKALKLLKEKGIYTFIASGRHYCELKDLPIQDLEFNGYVTSNGQYCYNNDELIYDLPIHPTDIINILDYLKEHPFPCMFAEKDRMYINYYSDVVKLVQESTSTPLPQLGDLNRGYTHPIYIVIPYDITEDQENELLACMPHCQKTRWHDLAIDIIPHTGGKKNGINAMLKHYGIKQEETMAFGDGVNDIDMFELVEIGIAMDNAHQALKEVADDITDDVEHDGIYNALIKYKIIEKDC